MDPQGGEGNQPSPPTAPIVESNVGVSSNPLDPLAGLEDVVNAAKEAAAVQAVTAPAQAPEKTPEEKFVGQFGEEVPPVEPTLATPPVAEPAPGLDTVLANLGTPPSAEVPGLKPEGQDNAPVAKLDPSIKTVNDLLTKGPQVVENFNPTVEVVAPPEQTPAERLKQQIAASVDAFLEEVTKKKVAA